MHFILTLVLMPIVALLYVAYSDAHSGARRASLAQSVNARRTALQPDSVRRMRRRVNWINQQEFPALLRRFETIILVDLRTQGDMKSALYSASRVLPTSPSQLNELLPWLPPETGVVLCGPPDLCNALLSEVSDASGAAAIYVLGLTRPADSQRLRLLAAFVGFVFAASAAFAQSPKSALAYSSSSSSNTQSSSSTDQGVNLLYGSQDSGQNGGGYGNSGYKKYPEYGQSLFHHLAIEGGAGFDAPIGTTSDRQTFGYNVKLGGGWNFSERFGVLIEYEFNRSGIPQAELNAVGAPDGNVHIWGFTLDPIYYLKNNSGWGGYVTGGYGFYRRLTSFTQPINEGYGCDFYGYCYPQYGNQTLSHFSSNQGGGSIGGGLTHSLGAGGAKVYVETRYLYVAAPSKSSSTQSGSGYSATNMIPVTFGIRF